MHRELVERARQGDSGAFDELARQTADRCMAIAFRILRDADLAQDVSQAALIEAWHDLPRLRDPDRFEPWLHRILINGCYAEARRRRQRPAELLTDATDRGSEPGDLATVNDRDEIDRAFRRLTVEQRTVLVFRHYLDLPLADVAERMGVPIGTAKSRIHNALAALRASLEADARIPATNQERLA